MATRLKVFLRLTSLLVLMAALFLEGCGGSGNSGGGGTTGNPPAAPTGLTATAGAGQVALSGTASGGPYTQTGTATTTSYTDTGLTNWHDLLLRRHCGQRLRSKRKFQSGFGDAERSGAPGAHRFDRDRRQSADRPVV